MGTESMVRSALALDARHCVKSEAEVGTAVGLVGNGRAKTRGVDPGCRGLA